MRRILSETRRTKARRCSICHKIDVTAYYGRCRKCDTASQRKRRGSAPRKTVAAPIRWVSTLAAPLREGRS